VSAGGIEVGTNEFGIYECATIFYLLSLYECIGDGFCIVGTSTGYQFSFTDYADYAFHSAAALAFA